MCLLVICCHVKITPKRWLKQHTYIISYFLWVKNLGTAEQGLLLHSISQGSNHGVGSGSAISSEGSTRKGSVSNLTQGLLATFIYSWAVGLRASLSCRLLTRSSPQFLTTWASTTWLLASSKCSSPEAIERIC